MKEFSYVIKDEIGIHARPAGMLAKTAKPFASKITVTAHGKTVDATKLMALMTLGAKCNDELIIAAEGEDEAKAIDALKDFVEKYL
jgi:phosphocarrier protein